MVARKRIRRSHLAAPRGARRAFSAREALRRTRALGLPPPIGEVSVVLAAQDEVGTLPHHIRLREMDVKFGGNEIDRLRRWYAKASCGDRAGYIEYYRWSLFSACIYPVKPIQVNCCLLAPRGIGANQL